MVSTVGDDGARGEADRRCHAEGPDSRPDSRRPAPPQALAEALAHAAECERRLGAAMEEIRRSRRAEVERDRLVIELRQALELRDRFLSVASHELKTPLTVLTLQAERLARSMRLGGQGERAERVAEGVASILRQVDWMGELVDQLLDVSRITSGRLALDVDDVSLSDVAREVVARFADDASSPIELRLAGRDPVVGRWDRRRLDQVLTNLLGNAVKYGAGRPIAVAVEPRGDQARLVVADQGIGIASADQGRIFERFERLGSERSLGGFGLGLWIARQIVLAFGGTIGVESEPGRGATFTVELPRDGALRQPADGSAE